MAKITMSLAAVIASKMAAAVYGDTIDKAKKELKDQVSEYVFAHIPDEIIEAYKKHPSYFTRRDYVSLVSGTVQLWNYKCEIFPSWDSNIVSISNQQMERVNLMNKNLTKICQENDSFKYRVEQTLLSLGTYKRIKEMFPEAYDYIPTEKKAENTTAIALPIQELQDIFNQAKTSAE